jgi:sugar phosphate isomerase/epimerase
MVRLSGFGDEISSSLQEQLDVLQQEGIHCLDLRGVWGKGVLALSNAELDTLKDTLEEREIEVTAIASPIGKVGILDPFPPHFEGFKKVLRIAEFFVCDYVRVFSFYIPEGESPERYRHEVMRRMREMTHAAEDAGITLLHENERGIYGDRPERCREILEMVDSPFLGVTFDPANFVQVGVKPYTEAFPLLKEDIRYLHVKDALFADGRVTPAGEGDGEIREVVSALAMDGFDGVLALEPHLKVAGRAGGFSGPEAFHVATTALKRLLDEIGVEYQ